MKEIHVNLQKTSDDTKVSTVRLRGNGQRNEVLDLLMQGTFTYLSSEFPSVDPMLAVQMYCHALQKLAGHYSKDLTAVCHKAQ